MEILAKKVAEDGDMEAYQAYAKMMAEREASYPWNIPGTKKNR